MTDIPKHVANTLLKRRCTRFTTDNKICNNLAVATVPFGTRKPRCQKCINIHHYSGIKYYGEHT